MTEEVKQPTTNKETSFLKHIKAVILYALNPANILQEDKKHKWFLFLILPAIGWMLFFMQVGLDRGDTNILSMKSILLLSAIGLAAGYVAVGLIGMLVTFIVGKLKAEVRFDQIASCIAMSHTYMVFSLVIGFIYRLFGASSSAVFGIAGLMCTLMPIYAGLRTLGKGKPFFAPLLATLIGVLLIVIWKLLMIIPL